MTRYQVHFEYTHKSTRRLTRGHRTVKARDEHEAICRVVALVPGSWGHWVNRLANEVVQ